MLNKLIAASILLIICFACKNNNKGNNVYPENKTFESMDIKDTITKTDLYLIVGTYTRKDSKGIYVYKFDTITGASKEISSIEAVNPSFLTVSNDEKFIYATSEDKGENAIVSAFSFDKESGSLSFLNKQQTGGDAPCYVSIDNTGENVIVANYSGGSISVFKTTPDGSLKAASNILNFSGKSIDEERQNQPHLHCVEFSPDQRFVFANDLGTDKIYKLKTDKSTDNYLSMGEPPYYKVKAGSGPRHMEFHPIGRFLYIITELSGEVIVFDYNEPDGNLSPVQTIEADSLKAQGSADIHISPDGRYLYASNRLEGDGIVTFSIDQQTGKLTWKGYHATGEHPRNFVISPNGEFLLVANRDSDNIQVFKIDKETGLLSDTKQDIELSMPVCLKFVNYR